MINKKPGHQKDIRIIITNYQLPNIINDDDADDCERKFVNLDSLIFD